MEFGKGVLKMTERDNLLMVYRGEVPEWLPRYSLAPPPPGAKNAPATVPVGPAFLDKRKVGDTEIDIWGVEHTATENTGGMSLPTPGKFILKDITKWRDVIKAPDISDINWEDMARRGTENINRRESVVELMTHVGYFQHLMEFMGFTEGLTAMYEEPEEVMALFEYLSDFYVDVFKKSIEYYKPDVMCILDDTATAINPFISLDMYREMVKPYHERLAKIARDAGLFINMHNCGRCEDFIDDWLEMGISIWNPAQTMNDLEGIKKKYGNKLVLVGCWDSSGPPAWPGATEELVRSEVRKCIDTFAPGGGFCFWGSIYGANDDPDFIQRRQWLTDEYNTYGRSWYKNHR